MSKKIFEKRRNELYDQFIKSLEKVLGQFDNFKEARIAVKYSKFEGRQYLEPIESLFTSIANFKKELIQGADILKSLSYPITGRDLNITIIPTFRELTFTVKSIKLNLESDKTNFNAIVEAIKDFFNLCVKIVSLGFMPTLFNTRKSSMNTIQQDVNKFEKGILQLKTEYDDFIAQISDDKPEPDSNTVQAVRQCALNLRDYQKN